MVAQNCPKFLVARNATADIGPYTFINGLVFGAPCIYKRRRRKALPSVLRAVQHPGRGQKSLAREWSALNSYE